MVEEVDGRFTKSHFAGGDGNLYKEAWPSNLDAGSLDDALETNEQVADNSVLLQFATDLLAAGPAQLPGVVADYIDIDNALSFIAVDRSIDNWDGMSAFYCVEGACNNHNYYWYQDEAEPRFALIPWDLDNTFAASSPLGEVPGALQVPADCSVRYAALDKTLMAPACDPLLRGLAQADRARYVAQLDRLLAGPFAPGALESWVGAWHAQLEPLVSTDPRGPEPSDFEAGITQLYDAIGRLRTRLQAERDGF